jgi:hypothetical protein
MPASGRITDIGDRKMGNPNDLNREASKDGFDQRERGSGDTSAANPSGGPPNDTGASQAGEPPLADVSVPQDDDELNDALEDSFPASDPINFAGSSIGSPEREETEEPPVGTHPMGGSTDQESGLEHVSRAAFGTDENLDELDEDDLDEDDDINGSSSQTPPVL